MEKFSFKQFHSSHTDQVNCGQHTQNLKVLNEAQFHKTFDLALTLFKQKLESFQDFRDEKHHFNLSIQAVLPEM